MPTRFWIPAYPYWWQNLPGYPRRSQANVTTVVHNGRLFARDEVGLPLALDPDTLAERGPCAVVDADPPATYKAHTKTDAHTGHWVLLGWSSTARISLDVIVRGADGHS